MLLTSSLARKYRLLLFVPMDARLTSSALGGFMRCSKRWACDDQSCLYLLGAKANMISYRLRSIV